MSDSDSNVAKFMGYSRGIYPEYDEVERIALLDDEAGYPWDEPPSYPELVCIDTEDIHRCRGIRMIEMLLTMTGESIGEFEDDIDSSYDSVATSAGVTYGDILDAAENVATYDAELNDTYHEVKMYIESNGLRNVVLGGNKYDKVKTGLKKLKAVTRFNKQVNYNPESNAYAYVFGQNQKNFEKKYDDITECLEDTSLSEDERKYAISQGYLREGEYINPMMRSFNKDQLYFYAKGLGLKVTRKTNKVDICRKILDN